MKEYPRSDRWIAAQFTELPDSYPLGKGDASGAFRNRPLKPGVAYVVFVAAYKSDEQVYDSFST